MIPSKHRLGAALVALLLISSGAVLAYTTVFTAGSGTSYETGSGLVVSTTTDHGVDAANPFNDSETAYIDGVSFSSSGAANLTVDQFRGEWTNVSSVDASTSSISIDPDDKPGVDVTGSVTAVSYRETALDDDQVAFVYSASGSGTVSVHGLSANQTWTAATTSGQVLDNGTTDGSGVAAVGVDSASNEEVVLFTNKAPLVDNASASPTGSLTQQSVTLSINTSDQTFASTQGDELNATFYVDGETVGTDTLTSNGTASVQYDEAMGGTKNWYVVVTDNYGATVTSDTFSFQSPSTLDFRKETSPSELVDSATVQVTAYYSGDVERRNVTDGQLNLTDFPVDEPIIIRVNASGYYSRTAVIESVYDQSNVYMLNSSRSSYLIRFQLQDLTGDFPESDTVLFVERDINLNNSTEWRVIAGDNFGVKGVPVNLEQDERYRLRIKNLDTGQTVVIGAFTPVQSETVTISTGGATIEIPESEKTYGWAIDLNESAQQINFRYEDTANSTESVKLTIHERFNKSNVLVNNVTFTGSNDISYTQPLTANQTNTTWMGELYVDRGNDVMHFRLPLSGGIQNIIPAGLDAVWLNGVGVFVVLISSLAFSELNQGVGAIATGLIGGLLWWFGVLSNIAIGPTIVVALVVSVVYHYYSNPSPGGGI